MNRSDKSRHSISLLLLSSVSAAVMQGNQDIIITLWPGASRNVQITSAESVSSPKSMNLDPEIVVQGGSSSDIFLTTNFSEMHLIC